MWRATLFNCGEVVWQNGLKIFLTQKRNYRCQKTSSHPRTDRGLHMKFVVCAHHTRLGHAQRLAALLDAHLLIDDGNQGANWNHRRALEWAAEQTCRVVVLEDDALPVHGFTEKITDWLARFLTTC